MPYRDFGAERAERDRTVDPITFAVTDGGPTFTARTELPFDALVGLATVPELAEIQANPMVAIAAAPGMADFLASSVIPEQEPEMRTELASVSVETLTDLIEWLAAEYTGRPTSPSGASAAGRPSNGTASTSPVGVATSDPSAS